MAFTSKYNGTCAGCPSPIIAGQEVCRIREGEYAGQYAHKQCIWRFIPRPEAVGNGPALNCQACGRFIPAGRAGLRYCECGEDPRADRIDEHDGKGAALRFRNCS